MDIGRIKFETKREERERIDLPSHNNPSFRTDKQTDYLGLIQGQNEHEPIKKLDLDKIAEEQYQSHKSENQSDCLSDINQDESMKKMMDPDTISKSTLM